MKARTVTPILTKAEARALIRAARTHRQVLKATGRIQGIGPLDRGAAKLQEVLDDAQ